MKSTSYPVVFTTHKEVALLRHILMRESTAEVTASAEQREAELLMDLHGYAVKMEFHSNGEVEFCYRIQVSRRCVTLQPLGVDYAQDGSEIDLGVVDRLPDGSPYWLPE